MKRIIGGILVVLFAASCDTAAPKPPLPALPAAANIRVTEQGESLLLAWDSVPDAEKYTVFYTADGSAPTTASASILASSNRATHDALDPAKTYRYAIRAEKTNFESTLSAPTAGNSPLPMMTLKGDFTAVAGKKVLVVTLDVPYDPILKKVVGNTEILGIQSTTPAADGSITVRAAFPRDIYLGYAIAIDEDANGVISAGDIVTGTGGTGSYGYSYWDTKERLSFEYTQDWASYTATHVY